jgi:DNA-binding CsgD family transcriptional regulator
MKEHMKAKRTDIRRFLAVLDAVNGQPEDIPVWMFFSEVRFRSAKPKIRITCFNQTFLDDIGYTPDEIISSGCSFLKKAIHPSDVEKLIALSGAYLHGEADRYHCVIRFRSKFRQRYVPVLLSTGIRTVEACPGVFHLKHCGIVIQDIKGSDDDMNALAEQLNGISGTSSDIALTRRELEVVAWLSRGCCRKMVSEKLFISEATVKTHINNVLRKTGYNNMTAAACALIRKGLI